MYGEKERIDDFTSCGEQLQKGSVLVDLHHQVYAQLNGEREERGKECWRSSGCDGYTHSKFSKSRENMAKERITDFPKTR